MDLKLTPDDGSPSPFRRKVVKSIPIKGTRTGHDLQLECGHVAISFGNLAHAPDGVICDQCREKANASPHR